MQEAKLQSKALEEKQQELEQPLRRSKRVAAASILQQELLEVKAKLEQCQSELNSTTAGVTLVLWWLCIMAGRNVVSAVVLRQDQSPVLSSTL